MGAGGGDPESGLDEPLPGLDDPGVSVRGAGLDDDDGLGGGGDGVDQRRAVGFRELIEDVGDRDEISALDGERRSDTRALPTHVP